MRKALLLSLVALISFAASGLAMDKSVRGSVYATSGATAVEVSFPCLLWDKARTHIPVSSSNGTTGISINPQYIFEGVAENLELGVGPSVDIATGNGNTTTGVSVAASADYAIEKFHVGLQVGFGSSTTSTGIKVGYAF